MLDITKILTEEFVEQLAKGYKSAFDKANDLPDYGKLITDSATEVIRLIASSNTLYHNVEHTIQVTLVGQAVLLGKINVGDSVSPEEWLNCVLSLLCHDIGYAPNILSTGESEPNRSIASDALLMPVHIDRGKQFVEREFADQSGVDISFIQACIERTRFPVPTEEQYQATDDFPGLVRGADLVGQLSDPRYFKKLPAVFYEFEESGYNEVTGYKQPGDLLQNYLSFYEASVEPYVQETLKFLSMTPAGREIVDSFESNNTFAKENTHRF